MTLYDNETFSKVFRKYVQKYVITKKKPKSVLKKILRDPENNENTLVTVLDGGQNGSTRDPWFCLIRFIVPALIRLFS